MIINQYQAKYYAYELTKRCPSDSVEKLSATLMDAKVDLNPHQIEAALFAFNSPLSKGAILADEVGLGKTIEAGILLSQHWAVGKRKLLIICPSSLRKQWNQELMDKFYLPSMILETKSFNQFKKNDVFNPFEQTQIVITSYNFASNKSDFLSLVNWDLVIIDEAHKLRNVYRPNNKIGNNIKNALELRKKVLLTATPLQNSLLELFGLVSIIDEFTFGDIKSFKSQFSRLNNEEDFDDLKERLKPICKRNLRRQVQEYINYTNRIPLTINFTPSKDEQLLYDMVSEYLQRESLYALPNSQRHLITLILRKLLASSTHAIAKTIGSLAVKLDNKLKKIKVNQSFDDIFEDYDTYEELEEEYYENEVVEEEEFYTDEEIKAIENEVEELYTFRDLAENIVHNAKGEKLKTALEQGFDKLREFKANEKAIIFTESQRTQYYLKELLEQSEDYKGKVVLFNGQNNTPEINEIYQSWIAKHKGTDVISGAKSADTRAAIVEHFRNEAKIMIATEAAAEGINLQFCSLLINYDLPWNPQRIEQRIGRCHRYGQKFDVVVVNFVNTNNAADQRVFEILNEKFKLFDGVFGASDEVLGSIESGIDFEKKIAEIYQYCRTNEEINLAFDKLKEEFKEDIDVEYKKTRQKLLENFDEEVIEKLKVTLNDSEIYLNKYQQWLWKITKLALKEVANFDDNKFLFQLNKNPYNVPSINTGRYQLNKEAESAYFYRLGHPLAQSIINYFKEINLENSTLTFDYTGTKTNIALLEKYIGKKGSLQINQVTVSALEEEDYIVLSGISEDTRLTKEECERLLSLPVKEQLTTYEIYKESILENTFDKNKATILRQIENRNATFFDEELEKLDKWSDDKRNSLKVTLKELEEEIKDLKRISRLSQSLPEKLSMRKKLKDKEQKRDEAWRQYEIEGRKIEEEKDKIIDIVEAKLQQKIELKLLFKINWELI
ncbi:SNF2-related protein [Flavobacterium cyclinae]|uniref:SNF2-related protein n=1 Tax=Flavobacterium cyclinae TaxID=2895947 RepID=UPI001E60DAD7|nr:SNF2-related protein [Flavobacterium cyclinae]UGS22077.1 SNF2-related protein [Flavobacterium cyclinae]